ncbi:MAG: phenylalanine--tRNA ligase subunit beta [Candidatus Omnitrophica bacterium]|nr:phenylalanine--tRNA ligase subunit beta [Candidatus Omnitrophota bacterium]
MKLSWNWLKDYVIVKKSPEEIAERLTMTGLEVKRVEKIGRDFLLETEVTSNRPDLLSHIGVAREIAAVCGASFHLPSSWKSAFLATTTQTLKVKVLDPNLCPYYSGVIVEGIQMTKTPDWMVERLELCGIRSIHFLVDVTNYVLLEWGQPLHAFDFDKLHGNVIMARRAKKDEKLIAIDGNLYELKENDTVISDEEGALALGGVMGGKSSEVSESTRNILLESAYFVPAAIRQTAKRLKLGSESSYRFERGVDPSGVACARDRALDLITHSTKIECVGKTLEAGKLPVQKCKVLLHFEQINKTLGQTKISIKQAQSILDRLKLKTRIQGKGLLSEIPSFRFDVSKPEDLIEEIARVYGYDKIQESLPTIQPSEPTKNSLLALSDQIQDECVVVGLREVVTFSLVNPTSFDALNEERGKWVQVENPRNQNLTLMRPSLIANFLEVVKLNFGSGFKSLGIFEVANCYFETGDLLPGEERVLAVALVGDKPSNHLERKRSYEFEDMKGIFTNLVVKSKKVSPDFFPVGKAPLAFEPGFVIEVRAHGVSLGWIGLVRPSITQKMRIEPPVFFGEVSLTKLDRISEKPVVYREISRFPIVERDLALIVSEEVKVGDLIQEINVLGRGLVRAIELFDLYRGSKLPQHRKSVAFHIRYQSEKRTLEAKEVDELHFSIVNILNQKFKAELPPAKG